MKISFVIPAFNEEKNIPDCVRSIQAEIERFKMTRKDNVSKSETDKTKDAILADFDFEIIVVNNNSKDNTKEVALALGVTVVDESNKGIIWARKAGLEASTGDIIANIDADNRVPKGWLTTVYWYFEKDPDLLALSGPLEYYDSPAYIRFGTYFFYVFGYIFDKIIKLLFGISGLFQGGNYIVKKDAMKQIGGYDTSIVFYGEDTDIGKRISKIGKKIWTFDLPMLSSGRRIQQEGIVVMGYKYAINYLWTTFSKKPFHGEEYIDLQS